MHLALVGRDKLPFDLTLSSQLLIRMHNETLSVVAVRVSNRDRSPIRING